ncbi:ABC transporter permease [Roseimaritima multifibrata]|nr:ABC-2 family transporter protein [Roseimaritima multifibrata]
MPTPHRPHYGRVFLTFARNSLIRDMTFRTNFIFQCISSVSWTLMNIGFYMIIFQFTRSIGADTGWEKYHFYIFLATTWLINSLVQAFFMPNAEEFSELIRTGGLDFALLKPIDTQFLISFRRIDWSALSNFFVGLALLFWAVYRLMTDPVNPMTFSLLAAFLYVFYIGCGALIMYSLMICLSATSVWLGRNQTLYNFWFYITNFSRYPMEIYQRSWGWSLWGLFTFAIPVLVVVNVPARILARPLDPRAWWEVPLAVYALFATVISLAASRWIFKKSLGAYRSASS